MLTLYELGEDYSKNAEKIYRRVLDLKRELKKNKTCIEKDNINKRTNVLLSEYRRMKNTEQKLKNYCQKEKKKYVKHSYTYGKNNG